MIRSRPWRAARSRARSCVLNISRRSRLSRIARRPSGPPGRTADGRSAARRPDDRRGGQGCSCSSSTSNVRTVTAPGAMPSTSARYASVLLVLADRLGRGGGQQELRSKQADAVGARLARRLHVARQLDVRLEAIGTPSVVTAAAGGARRAARRPEGRPARGRARATSSGGGSMISSPVVPSITINAPGATSRLAVQAEHGGYVERPREDRRVVGPAAGVAREALDLGPVHLRGERGRELVGDEHRPGPTSRNRSTPRPRARARFIRRRPATSATSPFRSRRYASSIPSKTPASSSKARWTAHSALTRCSSTRCRTRSISIGSSSISSCASNR